MFKIYIILKIKLKPNHFLGKTSNLYTDKIGHVPSKSSSLCQSLVERTDNDFILRHVFLYNPLQSLFFIFLI